MIMTLIPMVSHGQKSNVGPYFYCFDLRNAVVALMILSVSCAVKVSVVMWQKSGCTSLDHLDLQSAMVALMILSASCDANTSSSFVTLPESYVLLHFDHLDIRNAMVPLTVLSLSHNADTNAVASHDSNSNTKYIMWCQWHHITKFILHLISIALS